MRTPVTLKIKFKSSSLDQFIERYSVDVSRGGIFIRTKEPLAVGTQLKFEFQLQDTSSLISGEGVVVWIREHDPSRSGVAPGMGVRFDKLATASQQVLDRILMEKSKRGEAAMESRFDAGVRASAVASGTVSTTVPTTVQKVALHNDFGGGDSKSQTPLPAPAPGLDSGADEFGEESTRVMQDAVVQALADRTRGDEAAHLAKAVAAAEPAKRAVADAPSSTRAETKVETKPEMKVEVAPEPARANGSGFGDKTPLPGELPMTPAPIPDARPVVASEPPRAASRKSSGLPMVAAVVVGAIAVGGYVMYRGQEDSTDKPAPSDTTTQVQTPHRLPAKFERKPPVAAQPPAPGEENKPPEVAAQPPEAVKPAGLTVPVTSDPVGAQVLVNGKPLAAPTPTELAGLEPGKSYDVRVNLKGFHEWKSNLTAKSGDKLEAKLVANEKLIEVSSTPAGADVMLDGRRVGKTPYVIHKLDFTKPHELALKRAGFVQQTRNISSGDSFESKGDKDVLALAMTLEAEAKAAPPLGKSKHPTSATKKNTPTTTVSAPVGEPGSTAPEQKPVEEKPAVEKPVAEKPAEKPAAEKPVAEKPAAEKPAAEKPAEKPAAEKPAEKDKPTDKDKPADKDKPNLKTPTWMQDSNSDNKQQ